MIDFSLSDRERAFVDEARAWLSANVPALPLPSGDTAEGFARHLEWERRLFDAGWAVVSWPKAYGGREASLFEWLLFEEEYYRAGAPNRVTQNGIFLLAPTLFEFGTEAQRERILRPMARGDVTWAQGWSEPGAGSDLASVVSRANRVQGGWRVSGQKTWCTRAAFCDRMYGLFVTDPEAEKRHRGLTYLMVDLRADGVTVRPFGRLDGDDGFAEVFLDDVFVPDEDVIGPVNGGWKVAMATNPALRHEVARISAAAEAYRLFTLKTATAIQRGESVGAESSLTKLWWSELDVALHETALALLGSDAALDSEWTRGWQFALAGPIYAGTNEIQRNIVARRVLGLPR